MLLAMRLFSPDLPSLLLAQSPKNYAWSDALISYSYRTGLVQMDYSSAAAAQAEIHFLFMAEYPFRFSTIVLILENHITRISFPQALFSLLRFCKLLILKDFLYKQADFLFLRPIFVKFLSISSVPTVFAPLALSFFLSHDYKSRFPAFQSFLMCAGSVFVKFIINFIYKYYYFICFIEYVFTVLTFCKYILAK